MEDSNGGKSNKYNMSSNNTESDIVITVDTLLSDLPFDSIKFIKMVVALESEFDFEFDDEKLLFTQFQTVKSLIEYVNFKVNSLNT